MLSSLFAELLFRLHSVFMSSDLFAQANGPHGFSFLSYFFQGFIFSIFFLPAATGRRRHRHRHLPRSRHRFLRFSPSSRRVELHNFSPCSLFLSRSLWICGLSSLPFRMCLRHLKSWRRRLSIGQVRARLVTLLHFLALFSLFGRVFVCTFITMLAIWGTTTDWTPHHCVLCRAATFPAGVLTLRLRLNYDVMLFISNSISLSNTSMW